jgi:hypothetical protein
MRRSSWIHAGALACITTAALAGGVRPDPGTIAQKTDDPDVPPIPTSTLCSRPVADQLPAGALAIVVLPGPMSNTRIPYEIWNYSDDSIAAVSVDGFDALGGQGLSFTRATTAHAARIGAVRVDYPQSGVEGHGPLMVGFEGFGPGQCAAVDTEASTWGSAGFRARMMDMVGARIQMVFEGGLRGTGQVLLCGSNGRVRDIPCRPGDGVAMISQGRTVQVRVVE